LARKTALRKPNRGEEIVSTKPRPENVYDFLCFSVLFYLEYGHQRAGERHDNLPQGNQDLLVVRDKVGRPPG